MKSKKTLLGLGGFVIWMLLCALIYNKIKTLPVVPINEDFVKKKELIDSIQKNTFKEFGAYLDYRIQISKNRESLNFESSITDSVSSLLSKSVNKKVIITALYNLENETRKLAKKRAQAFEDSLLVRGVNPSQIDIYTASYDFVYNNYNAFDKGILLRYESLSDQEEQTDNKATVPKNKIIYTAFARNNFVADEDIKNYVKKLKIYMVQHPNIKIKIVGHTDNVGSDEDNKWISEQRAKSVKKYLVINGIDSRKIKIIAMGESQPITSNDTAEGKRINRRVEIIIY